MSEETPRAGLSRRDFIKGVVATGAVTSSAAYLFRATRLQGQPAAAGAGRGPSSEGWETCSTETRTDESHWFQVPGSRFQVRVQVPFSVRAVEINR